MIDFPDVLGKELRDAKALLEAEGLDFIIAETKPVKKEITDGELRVIKVRPPLSGSAVESADRSSDQCFVLTVCRI